MILLDTNVISETLRAQVSPHVQRWMDRQTPGDLYLCAPVIAELRFGAARLAPGKKRTALEALFDRYEQDIFAGRILPFDTLAAHFYAGVRATRQTQGRPIQPMDALIAAIARANGAKLATRNTGDFDGLDIVLVNPFITET